jgi:cation diffusion facilitator family transporter
VDERKLLLSAKRVITISIIVSLLIAFVEIMFALITNSLALLADGFDAVGNAVISIIVLIGILMMNKRPDEVFNFGYYKVENLASFVVSFLNILMAGYVVYLSILSIISSHVIHYPQLALSIAIISLIPSFTISAYKLMLARRLGYLSIKSDAINSLKDSLGSITAIIGLYLTTLGFWIFDTIAAIIISALVLSISFFILRESTYILLDACKNPELRNLIIDLAKNIEHIKKVVDVRMRKIGPLIHTEIEIEVDENITVKKMKEIIKDYEERVKKIIVGASNVSIIVKP